MATPEVITPSCEVTGLPLPILPPEPHENGALFIPGRADVHHHFHPRRDPNLLDVGGFAVRNSRVQLVNVGAHHNAYHDGAGLLGPKLPEIDSEKFVTCVKARAHVVPRQAIKFNTACDWEIVDLSDKQHKQVSRSIGMDQRNPIARFFTKYIIDQGIEGIISDSEIEEFLDERTHRKRVDELGRLMIREATGQSISTLNLSNQHKELKREGYIASEKPKTFHWIANKTIRMRHVDYFCQLAREQLATV